MTTQEKNKQNVVNNVATERFNMRIETHTHKTHMHTYYINVYAESGLMKEMANASSSGQLEKNKNVII